MSNELMYSLRILITHPKLTPNEISGKLGLHPRVSMGVGMPIVTTKGRIMPGVYQVTKWSVTETRFGDRQFLKRISRMLTRLEPHKEFLRSISDTGGKVTLIVDLPGDVNIGDVLSANDLGRMADLGIRLGIEVFPHTNRWAEKTIWKDDP